MSEQTELNKTLLQATFSKRKTTWESKNDWAKSGKGECRGLFGVLYSTKTLKGVAGGILSGGVYKQAEYKNFG